MSLSIARRALLAPLGPAAVLLVTPDALAAKKKKKKKPKPAPWAGP